MAKFMSNGIDFITRLDMQCPIDGIVVVRADGRQVYCGTDTGVLDRWIGYWRDRTPWLEILQAEKQHV